MFDIFNDTLKSAIKCYSADFADFQVSLKISKKK